MKRVVLVVVAACGGDHASADAAIDAQAPAQLVAHYAMDDDPNIFGAVDSGGRHLDGNCGLNDCPTLVAGHTGMAFHFDGTTQHVRIADNGAFKLTHGFSVALWIAHDVARTDTVVAKPLASAGDSWELDVTPTGYQFCTTHAAAVECLPATATVAAGAFVHVAITWDGAAKHVFIAGVDSATAAGATDFDATLAVIGADIESGTLFQPFQGAVDEVRIYDGALTPGEVAGLAAM